MSLVVHKYGGSSVADAEGVERVAKRIVGAKRNGRQGVVVVSAMGDTTDELIDLAEQVSPMPPGREFDVLLTAGERITDVAPERIRTALDQGIDGCRVGSGVGCRGL